MSSEYIQASIDHLKYSQNGGALRARFRDGVTDSWTDGYLVGWVQGSHPWMCCDYAPDAFDHFNQVLDGAFSTDWFKYCEILASDLEAR